MTDIEFTGGTARRDQRYVVGQRLLDLTAAIRAAHEPLDMNEWLSRHTISPGHDDDDICGTPACLGGHALMRDPVVRDLLMSIEPKRRPFGTLRLGAMKAAMAAHPDHPAAPIVKRMEQNLLAQYAEVGDINLVDPDIWTVSIEWDEWAAAVLGMSPDDSNDFFYMTYWPDDLREAYDEAEGTHARLDITEARIHRWIEHGE